MKNRIRALSYLLSGVCLAWAFALPLHARPSPTANAAVGQDQGSGQEEPKPKPKSNRPDENQPAQQQEARPGERVRPEEKTTKPQENRTAREPRTPQETPNQPSPSRSQAAGRRGGQAHANYQFRSQDVSKLRQYYRSKLSSVTRANRVQLSEGGSIPQTVVTYIQPVPVEIVQVLPPPPPGYLIGFYDGYVIVYDPDTLFIVAVIDLL